MTSGSSSPIIVPPQLQLTTRLEEIFMPYATGQRQTIYQNSTRFVHYTSAEAALSIINNKCIWMRNTTCMSDYKEVQHGFEILNKFFSQDANWEKFIKTLDTCVPGAAQEAIDLFGKWWSDIRINTYIASISEHDDKEDFHGRLSMWRAFGGNAARVALVLKIPYYSEGSFALNIIFSPVAYLTEVEVNGVINSVIANINANMNFIKSVDHSLIVSTIFIMLLAGVVCLKHEGFHEEREWRVIYAPKRSPSPLMESSTEVIGGIPQIIYKLPLDNTASKTFADLDLSRIFDRIIIGPTQYSRAIYEAFVSALTKIGVLEAEKRVFISGIPIRT